MSYLSELTAHERLTVDNATLDMFTAFENGSDLIYDIWEQYFSDRERKNEIRGAGIKCIAPGKCGGKNEHHGRAFTEAAGFYS